MKRICAWCEKDLPPADCSDDQKVTHGICVTCSLFYTSENKTLKEFLDDIEYPVLAVNSEGIVKTANDIALYALKKDLSEVEDQRGGIVMDCPHSKLLGGCGHTEHCIGCQVRGTVMATHKTHESQQRRAYMLFQREDNKIKQVYYDIVTELVNDVVVLRIDEIGEVV